MKRRNQVCVPRAHKNSYLSRSRTQSRKRTVAEQFQHNIGTFLELDIVIDPEFVMNTDSMLNKKMKKRKREETICGMLFSGGVDSTCLREKLLSIDIDKLYLFFF